nr:phage Gp37/Gp68 family protein [Paraburkholderia sp. Ac-20347]
MDDRRDRARPVHGVKHERAAGSTPQTEWPRRRVVSENSKIEWTDHTFNSWEGCQKVGPGCDHCYAEARNSRFAGGTAVNWGPGAPRRRTSPANWRKPLAWNAAHAEFFAAHGRRQRVFCASLADVFDNAVDPAWHSDLWNLILATPNLDWLLLTKRIGNAQAMLPIAPPLSNVWLGATIVNQEEADRDIPKLLAVPARVRFLSMEPLLGDVDLTSIPWGGHRVSVLQGWNQPEHGIHWVIVGGESGPGARPMHPRWARAIRAQCAAAGTPFLFKQWGEWSDRTIPNGTAYADANSACLVDGVSLFRIGKKAAGRVLDGRTHDEFPRGAA